MGVPTSARFAPVFYNKVTYMPIKGGFSEFHTSRVFELETGKIFSFIQGIFFFFLGVKSKIRERMICSCTLVDEDMQK